VRLFTSTRNGFDWTDCYPMIGEAALRNRTSSFVIDGETVLLGVDSMSDFNGLTLLRSNRHLLRRTVYASHAMASASVFSFRPSAMRSALQKVGTRAVIEVSRKAGKNGERSSQATPESEADRFIG
jgi:hypothetical protein